MGSKKREERSKKREERLIVSSYFLLLASCFTLFAFTSFLFLPPVSAQENNDYEELVQRNLELRQKLKTLEEKYTALENERSVLIVHIRNLQAEKDKLARSGGGGQERVPAGDELKVAFGEVSKELSLVAQERDQFKKEFARLKEAQLKSESAIKALEEEKTKLNKEISQIQSTFQVNQKESAAAFGSLETEKASLADQIARLKETFEKEKETLLTQQEKAIEEAQASAMTQSQEAAKALEEERDKLHQQVKAVEQSLEEEKKNFRADKVQAVEEAQKKNKAVIKTLTEDKETLADEIVFLKKTMEQQKEDLSVQQREAIEKAKQEGDAVIKPLEQEIDTLTAKIGQIEAERQAAFNTAEEEKEKLFFELEALKKQSQDEKMALEEKQKALLAEKGMIEEKLKQMIKQLAMEEGLYRVKREELDARIKALTVEQEDLKAGLLVMTQRNEVWAQKLKKSGEEKKRVEEKSLQMEDEMRALRADFQKKEDNWRKEANAAVIEKKELRKKVERLEKAERLARKELADSKEKMEDFEVRIKELEEDMKARQITLKEYETLIRKLTAENTGLQTKIVNIPPAQTKISRLLGKKRMFLTPEDKQRLDMHFNLAVTYDKTGLYKQEEQEYLECLKIDSSDANVHYNLAVLYDDKLNDNTKAISHYKKYLELKPLGEDNDKVKQWLLYAEEETRLGRKLR